MCSYDLRLIDIDNINELSIKKQAMNSIIDRPPPHQTYTCTIKEQMPRCKSSPGGYTLEIAITDRELTTIRIRHLMALMDGGTPVEPSAIKHNQLNYQQY